MTLKITNKNWVTLTLKIINENWVILILKLINDDISFPKFMYRVNTKFSSYRLYLSLVINIDHNIIHLQEFMKQGKHVMSLFHYNLTQSSNIIKEDLLITIIFMKVFFLYFLLRWPKPISLPFQTYFVFFM